MRHLTDGTLRRIYDEPLALTGAEQEHYDSCAQCKSRFDSIANAARASSGLLATPAFEPQPAPALARLRTRIQQAGNDRAPWYQRWLDRNTAPLRPVYRPALAVVVALGLVGALTVTAISTNWIRVFEPRQIVAVSVSPSSSGLSKPLDYGQIKWLPAPPAPQQVADAATAQKQTGFPVLLPATLPNGVNGPVTYGVVSEATGSLTFDASRLNASAAAAGVRVSPMPASIDGSTLIVKGGPALIEVWGLSSGTGGSQVPTLVIAQTRVPTVDSSGASSQQLQDYLLAQPGVPPELAAQVRAIKDPSSTLPIPIPQGLATSEPVTVDGVQGLLIKAALGAGVVWVRNGVIYAVGGQLTPDQVLAIATSLH